MCVTVYTYALILRDCSKSSSSSGEDSTEAGSCGCLRGLAVGADAPVRPPRGFEGTLAAAGAAAASALAGSGSSPDGGLLLVFFFGGSASAAAPSAKSMCQSLSFIHDIMSE